jgi:hypothetical protein
MDKWSWFYFWPTGKRVTPGQQRHASFNLFLVDAGK